MGFRDFLREARNCNSALLHVIRPVSDDAGVTSDLLDSRKKGYATRRTLFLFTTEWDPTWT